MKPLRMLATAAAWIGAFVVAWAPFVLLWILFVAKGGNR